MVASSRPVGAPDAPQGFQSPSLRGSGRFTGASPYFFLMGGVSIPFIAGQWSLHADLAEARVDAVKFQSPSLRGSGRFHRSQLLKKLSKVEFQSPSLRGSGRF